MDAQIFSRRTAIKMAVAAASVPLIGLVGCGEKSIVGTWANDDGDEILQFDENGDCSVPFTYNGAWLESCDRYTIQEDKTLVLSSSQGNISSQHWKKTSSKEEAEEADDRLYFLNGDELVINNETYTRE